MKAGHKYNEKMILRKQTNAKDWTVKEWINEIETGRLLKWRDIYVKAGQYEQKPIIVCLVLIE